MEAQKKGLSSLPIRKADPSMYIAKPHVSVLGNYPVVQLPILRENSFIPLDDKISIIAQPLSKKSKYLKSDSSLTNSSSYYASSQDKSVGSSIVDKIWQLFSEPTKETTDLIEKIQLQTINTGKSNILYNEIKKAIKRYNHLKTPEAKKDVNDLVNMATESMEGSAATTDEESLNEFLTVLEIIPLIEDETSKYTITASLKAQVTERQNITRDTEVKNEYQKIIEYLEKNTIPALRPPPPPASSRLRSSPASSRPASSRPISPPASSRPASSRPISPPASLI